MSQGEHADPESMRLHRFHCSGCGECEHTGQVMHITDRGHRQLHRVEHKLGEQAWGRSGGHQEARMATDRDEDISTHDAHG